MPPALASEIVRRPARSTTAPVAPSFFVGLLRRAAFAATLVAAACFVPAGCGGRDDGGGDGRALAIGVQEFNANLFWSAGARPSLPAPFGPFRDRLAALRPRYFRLLVSWDQAQPRAGAPPSFARREAGCVRDVPPCAPYQGVRDRLRALASQQRAQPGGWQALVVLLETPAWAAAPAQGCEPRGGDARARPPSDLAAYRRFVVALIEEARRDGATLRYWSAWNEPNHPGFLNPQRERCTLGSAALAPERYARMVRALEQGLDAAPGDQRIVLGELAGYDRPRPTAASAAEFIRALPRDVACLSDVWSQHAYVGRSGRARGADYAGDAGPAGSPGLLAAVERALDAHGCRRRKRIWITETGVGGARAGRPRPTDQASLAAGCRDLQRALLAWYRDPRVDAAFQYTFREDNLFPVGLVDTPLTRTYPTYDLFRAWGGGRAPGAPPPALPASCR